MGKIDPLENPPEKGNLFIVEGRVKTFAGPSRSLYPYTYVYIYIYTYMYMYIYT